MDQITARRLRHDSILTRRELRAACVGLLGHRTASRELVELFARTVLSYLDVEDASAPPRERLGVRVRFVVRAVLCRMYWTLRFRAWARGGPGRLDGRAMRLLSGALDAIDVSTLPRRART